MRRNAYATAAGRGEGGRRLRSKVLRSPQKPPRHPRRPRNKRRIGPLLEYLEHSGGHRAALVVEGGCSVADGPGSPRGPRGLGVLVTLTAYLVAAPPTPDYSVGTLETCTLTETKKQPVLRCRWIEQPPHSVAPSGRA